MDRDKKKDKKNNNFNSIFVYLLIALVLTFLVQFIMYLREEKYTEEIGYGQFINLIEAGKIERVIIKENKLEIYPVEKDAETGVYMYYTGIIDDPNLTSLLYEKNVDFRSETSDEVLPIVSFVLSWILPIGIFYFIGSMLNKSLNKRMNGVMNIGNNSSKIYGEKKTGIRFKDVAGQKEAKQSLREIVDFLHNPKKYTEIGAKLPKGALLVGPPGTGKTLLAKAVAGEAEVPFFSITGSDFVEMFVGVGASRVRDLFKQAEQKAPCIVFIDEIDAIGKSRNSQLQSNDERENTLNQLLSEMDGFDSSKGVVILGATNRPEILDKALLRAGRFDRRIIVDKPDIKGRIEILKVHIKNVKTDSNINLNEIALMTSGSAGADLANIINEAALSAVRKGRNIVTQDDLAEAVEVIIAGQEKKDRVLDMDERKIVAYHEIGHALVAVKMKSQPVHKITIVPRTNGALGYTMQMPENEKFLMSKKELYTELMILMGGRAAEEVVFNLITTGASNDIEKATKLARKMITVYGMSDRFGMMALEDSQNQYLDEKPVTMCASSTASQVDEEVRLIISDAYSKAKEILVDNKGTLKNAAIHLLEQETITGEEFMQYVNITE